MQLRKLEAKDTPYMLEWMHDPDTNRLFRADFASFREEKVLQFIAHAQEDGVAIHRACVNEQDEYLGTVSLKNIDLQNKKAEYAISFRVCARGTGAALFATKEILRIAFEELALQRVYLNVLADNARANAFYKKCGFMYEGCSHKDLILNGVSHDLNWYAIVQ